MNKEYSTEERKLRRKEYDKKKYLKNKEKILKRKREYYQNNKEKLLVQKKKYYQINKEKLLLKFAEYRKFHKKEAKEYGKEYRKNHKKEKKEYLKEYRKTHRTEKNERHNNRLKNDINYKLAHYLRIRLCKAIKGNYKSGSAVRDLGCTIPELKIYLESKFQEGMNWDNHGEWHIDHIKPLASFDLTNRQIFLEAVNYKNLQPLWAEENYKKGTK